LTIGVAAQNAAAQVPDKGCDAKACPALAKTAAQPDAKAKAKAKTAKQAGKKKMAITGSRIPREVSKSGKVRDVDLTLTVIPSRSIATSGLPLLTETLKKNPTIR
jgi:hypothetical protein